MYFTRDLDRSLFELRPDVVYGSAIFKSSRAMIARFCKQWPQAVIGGTGTDSHVQVEDITGSEHLGYDYTEQHVDYSIGFTSRGCRMRCGFCVVPQKEGQIRSVATIAELWRGPTHPKKLHLLDNDFFGQPDWRARIREIREGGFRTCLSQGINIRTATDEQAEALASIEYRSADFQRRRVYTAWDRLKDEKAFFQGVDRLEKAGIPAKSIMAYMLVGFDPAETWESIWIRFGKMVDRGIKPFVMVFDATRADLKKFARWVNRGMYRFILWEEYQC